MTKKHFELIATVLRDVRNQEPTRETRGYAECLERIEDAFCAAFAADNARFDSARFIAACRKVSK